VFELRRKTRYIVVYNEMEWTIRRKRFNQFVNLPKLNLDPIVAYSTKIISVPPSMFYFILFIKK